MAPMGKSETYTSVEDEIFNKANEVPYNKSKGFVILLLDEKKRLVFSHHNDRMNRQEKIWLSELLTWETLFPKKSHLFPGRRPLNHHNTKESLVALLDEWKPDPPPHPCVICKLDQKDEWSDDCPFVRTEKCDRLKHGEFKYRLGWNDVLLPMCPKCWALKKEAKKEGWEML